MYSATLARASAGVPDAVSICTISSGTSFDAATTCSWVAGHVSTSPTSSSSDCGTPDAFMMWGCWPRYWVTIRRAMSSAVGAILVHRAHDELRPVDVVDASARPGRRRWRGAPSPAAL